MPIFKEDTLREEEKAGGFEPNAFENESFILNDKEDYPGELPYTLSDNEIRDSIATEKQIEDYIKEEKDDFDIENQSKQVWDLFDNEEPENDKVIESKDNLKESSGNESEKSNSFYIDETDENDISGKIKLSTDNDLIGLQSETNKIESKKVIIETDDGTDPIEIKIADEQVEIDTDFLKLIESDLEKSKKRKEEKPKNKIIPKKIEKTSEQNNIDFKPVEEVTDTITIDLSNFGISENDKNIPEQEIEETSAEIEQPQKIKKIKEKKEPKQKRKPISIKINWKPIIIPASAVAAVLILFFLTYSLFFQNGKFIYDLGKKNSKETKSEVKNKHVAKNAQVLPKIEIADTNKIVEKTEKPIEENIIEVPTKEKETPINSSFYKPTKNKKIKSTFLNPLYAVEVFNTPVREEAEKWVLKLNKKNINGTIIEYKLRNVTWYKVRFGDYKSRDEARHRAEKLGYSQIWIDRVK